MMQRFRYAFAAGFMLLSILTVSIWGFRVLPQIWAAYDLIGSIWGTIWIGVIATACLLLALFISAAIAFGLDGQDD